MIKWGNFEKFAEVTFNLFESKAPNIGEIMPAKLFMLEKSAKTDPSRFFGMIFA